MLDTESIYTPEYINHWYQKAINLDCEQSFRNLGECVSPENSDHKVASSIIDYYASVEDKMIFNQFARADLCDTILHHLINNNMMSYAIKFYRIINKAFSVEKLTANLSEEVCRIMHALTNPSRELFYEYICHKFEISNHILLQLGKACQQEILNDRKFAENAIAGNMYTKRATNWLGFALKKIKNPEKIDILIHRLAYHLGSHLGSSVVPCNNEKQYIVSLLFLNKLIKDKIDISRYTFHSKKPQALLNSLINTADAIHSIYRINPRVPAEIWRIIKLQLFYETLAEDTNHDIQKIPKDTLYIFANYLCDNVIEAEYDETLKSKFKAADLQLAEKSKTAVIALAIANYKHNQPYTTAYTDYQEKVFRKRMREALNKLTKEKVIPKGHIPYRLRKIIIDTVANDTSGFKTRALCAAIKNTKQSQDITLQQHKLMLKNRWVYSKENQEKLKKLAEQSYERYEDRIEIDAITKVENHIEKIKTRFCFIFSKMQAVEELPKIEELGEEANKIFEVISDTPGELRANVLRDKINASLNKPAAAIVHKRGLSSRIRARTF